jgi:hypothetical protein
MSKYDALRDHLSNLKEQEWRPTFKEIEQILGFTLPRSARSHAAWWSNNRHHLYPLAWMDVGWKTENLSLTGERITFRRVGLFPIGVPPNSKRSQSLNANSEPYEWDTATAFECKVSMRWKPIGRITLGESRRLQFPDAPKLPGLYRFRIRGTGGAALYIGESDNIERRFRNYRNPGPTQPTNVRLNQRFSSALIRGAEIAVAIVTDDAYIENGEGRGVADFTSKAVRCLFENAAIVLGGGKEIELLNRSTS